jgi:hypothetical protein
MKKNRCKMRFGLNLIRGARENLETGSSHKSHVKNLYLKTGDPINLQF